MAAVHVRILTRASLRYLRQHPWQSALAVLGVALGVAVVVAVDLANQSALRAFELSTETLTGRVSHQVVGSASGVPSEVYRRLRLEFPEVPAAPVLDSPVRALPAGTASDHLREEDLLDREPGRALRLLGIDPFAEAPFRPFLGNLLGEGDSRGPDDSASVSGRLDLRALLTQPATVLASESLATALQLRVGEPFQLSIDGRRVEVWLAGVLRPTDTRSREALADLLIADISVAQELLRTDDLSRVDLILGAAPVRAIEARLPPGCRLLPAAGRTQVAAGMTRSFRLNLEALGLLALVCGVLLVYNTMSFSVVQRRPLLGRLRAIGVTRRQLFRLVLTEAAGVGLAGSLLGVLLGIVLGRGLVQLVTRTVNDLYFAVSVQSLALPPGVLLQGLGLGIAATLVAALGPAYEATSAPPRLALARSSLESTWRRAAPRAALLGTALLLLGGALLAGASEQLAWVPEPAALTVSFLGIFFAILGCAVLTPLATVALMRLLEPVASASLGLLGRMAARGVVASLSRTAVAIAALTIAVSVTVGIGIMIDSFRDTVVRWLRATLVADVYISPAATGRGPQDANLDDALAAALAAEPGVAQVNTLRVLQLTSATRPAEAGASGGAAGREGVPTRVVVVGPGGELESDPGRDGLRLLQGDPDSAWLAFGEEGAVLISEPYAYRHDLGVGDTVTLPTDRGEHAFTIAAVYRDYGAEQGTVMLHRATYEQHFDDSGYSALAVFATPGTDVEALVPRLREISTTQAPDLDLIVRSHRALFDASLEIFDRTFLITNVLRLLAGAVAFLGVLSALLALQLERARELGVLRANGLTPRQLWRLVLGQTGLMGLAAGLLSLPIGLGLAWVMVHIVNRRSFGWTLDMQVDPWVLVQALLLALAAALLAGLYPAKRMAATPPAEALRSE